MVEYGGKKEPTQSSPNLDRANQRGSSPSGCLCFSCMASSLVLLLGLILHLHALSPRIASLCDALRVMLPRMGAQC